MAGAIPVRNNTRPVATAIRSGRSHEDGGARSSAGRLLGIRWVARINEAVTRANAGNAGRLTRWKRMVARSNASVPPAVAIGQQDRPAPRASVTAIDH